MNTRCLLLPAILVALFGVSWSPAGDLPQALAPHLKKITAELLVGKWRKVTVDGDALPENYVSIKEFTADGKVRDHVEKSNRLIPPRTGRYRLDGNVITFWTEPTTESPAQNWSVTIKVLDENKLILTAPGAGKGTEFVRVK